MVEALFLAEGEVSVRPELLFFIKKFFLLFGDSFCGEREAGKAELKACLNESGI